MLRKETIDQSTLELLNALMRDSQLKDFFLVGGTALSLQIGHRTSIDLDFFSLDPFSEDEILTALEKKYKFTLDSRANNTLKGEISGIKVDLITHGYPLVKSLIITENIRMASKEDIAAMKLNAISGNGTRLKDFVDIAYLSIYMPFSEMIQAYEAKYNSRNPAMVVKALNYHYDINVNEKIDMINAVFEWGKIEKRLLQMTMHPKNSLGEL